MRRGILWEAATCTTNVRGPDTYFSILHHFDIQSRFEKKKRAASQLHGFPTSLSATKQALSYLFSEK